MYRLAVLFLVLAAGLSAANVRLFLKDGSHHLVREYRVEGDRVHYFSIERAEWEEIPLDIVDLKKTEGTVKEREATQRKETAMQDAEEKAERDARNEISRVPQNTGVYYVNGPELVTVKQSDLKVVNNKRRAILKRIAPVPLVSGKSTVEVDGEKSAFVVNHAQPEFYIRLSADQRFGIIKLTPAKATRIVQRWEIMPVSNEVIEEVESIETFKRQVDDGVYKVWPIKPLTPGEYAMVEFTEGKQNIQVWDFSYSAAKQ